MAKPRGRGEGLAIWHPRAGIPRLTRWLNYIWENPDLWPESLRLYAKTKCNWSPGVSLSASKISEWMETEFNELHKDIPNLVPIEISGSWISRYLRGQSNPSSTLNLSHAMVLIRTGFLFRPDREPVTLDWLFDVLTLQVDPISEYERLHGFPSDSERVRLSGYISDLKLNPSSEADIDQFARRFDLQGDFVMLIKTMLLKGEEPIPGDSMFILRRAQLAHIYSLCDPSFNQTQFNALALNQQEAALR